MLPTWSPVQLPLEMFIGIAYLVIKKPCSFRSLEFMGFVSFVLETSKTLRISLFKISILFFFKKKRFLSSCLLFHMGKLRPRGGCEVFLQDHRTESSLSTWETQFQTTDFLSLLCRKKQNKREEEGCSIKGPTWHNPNISKTWLEGSTTGNPYTHTSLSTPEAAAPYSLPWLPG